LPRKHFFAQGRKKILPGFSSFLITREDVQDERVCPAGHARARTPIEGAEDGANVSRGEAEWFGLLCKLDLSGAESITRTCGRKQLSDLGTNPV